jgi:hypothetical protein
MRMYSIQQSGSGFGAEVDELRQQRDIEVLGPGGLPPVRIAGERSATGSPQVASRSL